MPDESQEVFSTNDVLIELRQARRTFQVFENAEKVVEYMIGLEQRQKDAEDVLAQVQVDIDDAKAKLDERIKTGETRAEDAERRAAEIDKQIEADRAKADQQIADAKAKLASDVEAVQQKIKDAKAELADLKKKIADAKKTLEGIK